MFCQNLSYFICFWILVRRGKVWNNSCRFKKDHMIPQLLRNMADYIERSPQPWIHPKEKPRPRKVSKRQYNRLQKIMSGEGKKVPSFPRKRKITKGLVIAFKKYKIDPYSSTQSTQSTQPTPTPNISIQPATSLPEHPTEPAHVDPKAPPPCDPPESSEAIP